MELNSLQPNLNTDSGQAAATRLDQLRAQFLKPEGQDQKKLKKAAQEFEAIFIQQMLDAMDKTIDRENSLLSGGGAEDYWRGMLNQEIAQSMSNRIGGSGFGLAESIYRQMAMNMKTNETESLKMGTVNEVSE